MSKIFPGTFQRNALSYRLYFKFNVDRKPYPWYYFDMKWICEKCKAINAGLAFKCHSCGSERPQDNGPHLTSESSTGGLLVTSKDLKSIRDSIPPIIPKDYSLFGDPMADTHMEFGPDGRVKLTFDSASARKRTLRHLGLEPMSDASGLVPKYFSKLKRLNVWTHLKVGFKAARLSATIMGVLFLGICIGVAGVVALKVIFKLP